jgi:hypothetical protein
MPGNTSVFLLDPLLPRIADPWLLESIVHGRIGAVNNPMRTGMAARRERSGFGPRNLPPPVAA